MCVLLCQSTAIYRWLAPEAAVGQLAQTLSNGVNLEADLVDSLLADVGLVPPDHGEAPFYDAAAALIRKHLDALADGMRSPLAYSMQQYPGPGIESVLLTGCGAAIPGAGTHLAKRLEVNVRTVGPADVVPCPPSLGAKASDPGLVVAVGLAQFSE
jgi:Tfp pilus assembly PilM family ATPase